MQGKKCANAHEILVNTYGDNALSKSTCKEWFARFKSGDFDVKDKERSGAPQKVTDQELEDILGQDPCQTLEQIGKQLGVDRTTVGKRLKALGVIQKEGVWVPHKLKERDIERRLVICELLLDRFNRKSFLHRIITCDEKWIYYDNPKRLKARVKPGQPAPPVPKRNIHSAKVMLCIWWDQKGVIWYELLKPCQTITADHYLHQLKQLHENLSERRPEWGQRHDKVILQHDNARPHVARIVKDYLEEVKWEVLNHPPYSPDLAPSDFHLFRSMASGLKDTSFASATEVKNWLDDWIASKDEDFFYRGIHALPERWTKCVASNGDYFN